jgi:hypothetical protein
MDREGDGQEVVRVRSSFEASQELNCGQAYGGADALAGAEEAVIGRYQERAWLSHFCVKGQQLLMPVQRL